MMQSQQLKDEKEDFVSNLSGSSIYDINLFLLIVVFSYSCHRLINRPTLQSQLLVIIAPVLIAMTFSQYSRSILLFEILYFFKYATFKRNIVDSTRQVWVTAYRALLSIITVIAILAVDFQIFPRKFAKVETYGTSLMDLGVGCFVFSSGLVIGNKLETTSIQKQLKSVAFLILIGFARLVTTRSVNYQLHVSEYGLHWNFFFTLSSLSIVSLLLKRTFPFASLASLSIFLGVGYEILLYFGLQEYLLNAPRLGLISMNKEGIFSTFGYVSIYLAAASTGVYILTPNAAKKLNADLVLLYRLVSLSLISWFILFVMVYSGSQISRRFANLPYVVWVYATNISLLTLFYATRDDKVVDWIIKAVNRNGLLFFLVGNLLTGFVNLTFNTIRVGWFVSLIILGVYIVTVVFATLWVDLLIFKGA